jgi:hypothetical protein
MAVERRSDSLLINARLYGFVLSTFDIVQTPARHLLALPNSRIFQSYQILIIRYEIPRHRKPWLRAPKHAVAVFRCDGQVQRIRQAAAVSAQWDETSSRATVAIAISSANETGDECPSSN